jgi:hypothetical protein
MRFVLPTLLLSAALVMGDIIVRSPVNDKQSLLGTWEGVNAAEDGYLFRMVLAGEDKGYLVWPGYFASEVSRGNRYRFFGQLQKLELNNGHLSLLFRRLPSDKAADDRAHGFDTIEIEGHVVGWRGNDEMFSGTATARGGKKHFTFKIALWKGEHIRQLAADARRAADDLEFAMKPGPIGTREEALEVLRKYQVIVPGPPGAMDKGTRVISVEWNEDSRRWVVELERPNGGSEKLSVDVPEKTYDYFFPDEPR